MNENRVSLDTNKANQLVNDTLDALSKVLETTSDSETIIKIAMAVKELEAVILKNGIDVANLKEKSNKSYSKGY